VGITSAGRGKSYVSAIYLDESSWWNPSETQNIMDVITGYWVKGHPYTLFTSTPSQPGDLMDQIFQQSEEDTAWRRIKMDWRFGEDLIYSQTDLKRMRTTTSWQREMELKWSPKSGSTFLESDIQNAINQTYDPDLITGNPVVVSVDPAFGQSGCGIVCTEKRGGVMAVLYAEDFYKISSEKLQ